MLKLFFADAGKHNINWKIKLLQFRQSQINDHNLAID